MTIDVPVIPKELRSVRVPAQVGPTAVAYVKDLQWVDTPDRLFQDLLEETILRTTNRVVSIPSNRRSTRAWSSRGQLLRFGYEAGEGTVIVRYDAALSTRRRRAGRDPPLRGAGARRRHRRRRSARRSTRPPTRSRSKSRELDRRH